MRRALLLCLLLIGVWTFSSNARAEENLPETSTLNSQQQNSEEEETSNGEGSQTEEGTEEEIGEIKVEEEEIEGIYSPEPTPKVVIKAEELERSALEDLTGLSRKSSFNIQEYFGGNALSLLGLNPKFTLILIDGQRLAGRIDEKIDASQVPLLGVERIEVIRGPLATFYGSGAVAGVVNIITKKPKQKLEASLRARGGSFGFNSQSLELGGKENSYDFFLAYRRAQRNSFDLNKRNAETDGDAFLNHYFKGKLSVDISPSTQLLINAGFFDENNENIQTTLGGISRRGEFDTRRLDLSSSLTRHLTAKSELTLTRAESRYGHDVRSFFVNVSPNNLTEDRFREELADTELSYKAYGTEHLFQMGINRSREHINSPRIILSRASQWQDSFFVNYEKYLEDGTSLSLGFRLDEHSRFGREFSPKFSIWKKAGAFDFRIGFGRGFRVPSLKELYFEFNSPFGYTVRGNPSLSPEIANTLIFTGSYKLKGRLLVDLSLFQSKVKDIIIPTEVSESPLVFKEINVSNARSVGATLNIITKAGRNLTFSLDQSFIIAKDVDSGNLLPQSPRYRGIISLLWDISPSYQVELVNSLISPQYTTVENTKLAPGYDRVDLNLGKKTHSGKWILSLRNLTNRVNRRYGPKPGREVFLNFEKDL